MTKTVNTEYNFWLAGYYDDFNSARATADDLNSASYRTLDHTLSHFGSALGPTARLNPRFKNSYPNRVRTGGYDTDDPLVSASDRYFNTSLTNKLAHNKGYADWLSRNIVEDNSELYNSRAILQYPISMVGNRQKYNILPAEVDAARAAVSLSPLYKDNNFQSTTTLQNTNEATQREIDEVAKQQRLIVDVFVICPLAVRRAFFARSNSSSHLDIIHANNPCKPYIH